MQWVDGWGSDRSGRRRGKQNASAGDNNVFNCLAAVSTALIGIIHGDVVTVFGVVVDGVGLAVVFVVDFLVVFCNCCYCRLSWWQREQMDRTWESEGECEEHQLVSADAEMSSR